MDVNKVSAKDMLRKIPKVDELLHNPKLKTHDGTGTLAMTEAVRQVLENLRGEILSGALIEMPGETSIISDIKKKYKKNKSPSLRRVINGTGVILHTNLGRAPLAENALALVHQAARGYSTLEYDVEAGTRGSRHAHVERLLTQLTGAEAAMAVNNNAAAVMLILSALASGKEVIVSRGELVEIGGSFRIPDIMTQSGCHLREVGTTNKTHLKDYENAIEADVTGALMKVHTSNFKIIGFTESVQASRLAELGKSRGLPVIEDLGSGCLLSLSAFGISDEPTVSESVSAGMDVVSFSGDKLLGGPQVGLIVGKAKYINIMKRHPLARALRIDKLTLAALEGTLRLYLDPAEATRRVPVLRMLAADKAVLQSKAAALQKLLGDGTEVIPEYSRVGGGSVPTQLLPTYAVALSTPGLSAQELESKLRQAETPVIGRIAHDRLLLDVRTLEESDFPYIASIIKSLGGDRE